MLKFLNKKRTDLPISLRLKILVIMLVLVVSIVGLFSISTINQINGKVEQYNQTQINNLINISTLSENIYSTVIENHIVLSRSRSIAGVVRIKSFESENIKQVLEDYRNNLQNPDEIELFNDFSNEFDNYIIISKEIFSLYKNNQDSLANLLRSTGELASFRKLQNHIRRIIQQNSENIEEARLDVEDYKKDRVNTIYIICSIIVLLSFFFSYFLVKDLTDSIFQLRGTLQILGNGEIPVQKAIVNGNDIGQMAHISNILVDNLINIREFAYHIGKGNYNFEFTPLGKQDVLGNSLINLSENLKIAKKEEERRKIEDEQRNWATKGLAMFGDILRQSSGDINELADQIIKNMVYYLNANQGGLFVYNDLNKEDIHIELLSAFAYDRKKFFSRKMKLGDGLVGMCALEKNTIYLTEIPDDYMEIESGLGDANPKCILITPLKTEDGILGVVEIASFNELQKYEIDFVETLTDSIASTLSTARNNARTNELLSESQKKSEELAIREEEMRQNMEEMRITQEEALRSKAEMTSILTAIDQTLLKSEHDIDGRFISANLRFLSTFGYHLDELNGKNVITMIPNEFAPEFKKMWEGLRTGHPHKITIKQKNKSGKTIWLLSQYTPVLNEVAKVVKILHLASDITEQKIIEEETKNQSQILINQEKELKRNLQAISDSQNEIGRKNLEITEKVYFFEQLLDAVSFPISVTDLDEKWTFINKAVENILGVKRDEVSGTSANKESILNQPGKSFKLDTFYTYDTKFNKTGLIDIFQDITEHKKAEIENQKLLQESRENANQLSAQDEEMRQTIDVLMSTQEQIAIKESEFQGIINAIDAIVMKSEYDIQGNLTDANQLYLDLHEYDLEELIGLNIDVFVPDDVKDEMNQIWKRVIKGMPFNGIVKRKTKSNHELWQMISFSPVINHDEIVNKVLSLSIDITREKLFEDQIAEYKKKIGETENELRKSIEGYESKSHDLHAKIKELSSIEKTNLSFHTNEEDELYNQWLNSLST